MNNWQAEKRRKLYVIILVVYCIQNANFDEIFFNKKGEDVRALLDRWYNEWIVNTYVGDSSEGEGVYDKSFSEDPGHEELNDFEVPSTSGSKMDTQNSMVPDPRIIEGQWEDYEGPIVIL